MNREKVGDLEIIHRHIYIGQWQSQLLRLQIVDKRLPHIISELNGGSDGEKYDFGRGVGNHFLSSE